MSEDRIERGDDTMAVSIGSVSDEGVAVRLESEDVAQMLPHCYPALFVEGARIWGKCVDDATIRARVSFNSPFLRAYHEGHFPGNPVVMNGFSDDAAGQVIAILALWKSSNGGQSKSSVILMREKQVKFLDRINLDDLVEIEARIEKRKGHLVVGSAEVLVGGVVVCEVKKLTGVLASIKEVTK